MDGCVTHGDGDGRAAIVRQRSHKWPPVPSNTESMLIYRLLEECSMSALRLSLGILFPSYSLTFPVVSFLLLGVFVFLSFFIRSAGGAKYSGGKGICPTHTQAPKLPIDHTNKRQFVKQTHTEHKDTHARMNNAMTAMPLEASNRNRKR